MPEIWPVAKKFFVTSGRASGETPKGTMQEALIKAGIQGCNLIAVSSVLDPDAVQLLEVPTIPHAALTWCVMAEQMGVQGESIAAGIGWCHMRSKDGAVRKAYVVEDHGHKEERAVEETLMYSLVQMAEAENLQIYDTSDPKQILLGRKEWLQAGARNGGQDYRGWKSPEPFYLKYLLDSRKFFKTAIRGYDKVSEDYGYCTAALVYVFEDMGPTAPRSDILLRRSLETPTAPPKPAS